MKFDREICQTLRDDINAVLSVVAEQHGISIKCDSARFSDDGITFKTIVRNISENNEIIDPGMQQFVIPMLNQHGVSIEKLKNVEVDGQIGKFSVVNYMSRRPKYPFIVKHNTNGKRFKVTPRTINRAIGKDLFI